MFQFVAILLTFSSSLGVLAHPATAHVAKRTDELPILTLEYGSFRATSYNKALDIYIFKNIRFGAPPIGDLRWSPPQTPSFNATISDGSYGLTCPQSAMSSGGLDVSALGSLIWGPNGEDCLFLNLFVPGKALANPAAKLPVIVNIYGGAYLIGSKEMLDGVGVVQQARNEVIMVVGNYRVGPLGFLAGSTMEKEATPNAGFHDQIAVFEWVQKYASLFGGNKDDVSAWGESAGGGSIWHHLIFNGGKRDPLFKKAIIQSPALNAQWDRKGQLEDVFSEMVQMAGCAGKGLACLRKAPLANITAAGNALNAKSAAATFAFGPQPDGKLVRQLPTFEYAEGNVWKGLTSVISSHVSDEGARFVDKSVTDDAKFDAWLQKLYPKAVIEAGWPAKIKAVYPNTPNSSNRMKDYIRDATFSCNTRYLSTAYPDRSYNIQYSAGGGIHGNDIAATYYSGPTKIGPIAIGGEDLITRAYQSYLISHAKTGNPNTLRAKKPDRAGDSIEWPLVNINQEQAYPVLDVSDKNFTLIKDTQNAKSRCDFLLDFWKQASTSMGYAM